MKTLLDNNEFEQGFNLHYYARHQRIYVLLLLASNKFNYILLCNFLYCYVTLMLCNILRFGYKYIFCLMFFCQSKI